MLIVLVEVRVKPGCETSFRMASEKNAAASRQEPGIAQFDLWQDVAEPTRFVLLEAYRDEEAPARHKETTHYAEWKESVESMMAEPRRSRKFHPLSTA